MNLMDHAQVNIANTGTKNDNNITFLSMDGNLNANGFDDRMVETKNAPLLSINDCELPEIPKTATSGQYFDFEQIANGIDGYFDENSDTDDENFGGSEDSSFAFDMCSIRPLRRSSKSPPEISPRKRLGNGRTMHRMDADEISQEVEEEGLDTEDVLCTVREGYTREPPLAQEDDFDDFDV